MVSRLLGSSTNMCLIKYSQSAIEDTGGNYCRYLVTYTATLLNFNVQFFVPTELHNTHHSRGIKEEEPGEGEQ